MVSKELADKIALEFGSGYWYVGENCFFNKIEAYKHAQSVNAPRIAYYYFDHVFGTLQGNREPVLTLEELYDLRARQIREKYKYVVLAVSGGSDSTNMLMAFLRQGLKVDEIYSYYPVKVIEKLRHTFDPTDTSPRQHMFEYDQAFVPLMEEVRRVSPSTKITILDFTDHAINIIGSGAVNDQFRFGQQFLHPGTAGPDLMFKELHKLNNPNAVLVIGVDKPRLEYDSVTGRFGLFFIDFQNFWSSANVSMGFGSPRIETFYYTPDLPELIQKQFFVVRRRMREIQALESKDLYNTLWRPSPSRKHVHLYNMQEPFFERLLYPSIRNHGVFQTKKPSSLFYNGDGEWLHGENSTLVDTRVKDFWTGQVNEFIHGIDRRFIKYDQGRPAIFEHVPTKAIRFA